MEISGIFLKNIFNSDLVESVDVELADVESHLTGGRHSWRNFEEPREADRITSRPPVYTES